MKKSKRAQAADERVSQMLSKLKSRQFRITPQRLFVLRTLAESDGHPTVEEIYEQVKVEFPTTSLATVYKTIALLKELDEVLELGFKDGSNRFDGNKPYPHPHAICTGCKKIMDSELSQVEQLNEEMSRKTGFKIHSHRLDFFGLCPDCQAKDHKNH